MQYIPNQPVYFFEQNNCDSCDEIPAQLSDKNDTIQFQLCIDDCLSQPQLLPNPEFTSETGWNLGDGWSISYGLACVEGESSGGIGTVMEFDTDKYYKIVVEVESISLGSSFDVLFSAGNTIGTITSSGTHTFYASPVEFLGYSGVSITPNESGAEICLESVKVYEILTDVIIGIYSEDGTYIDEFSYADNPDFFTLAKNTLTVTFNWSDFSIESGCFYLCLLDPCENTGGQVYSADITNPDFVGSATGWSLEGDAVYGSNDVVIGGGDYGFIYQDEVFLNYANQCVDIDITAITGTVTVKFGNTEVGTITTTGIKRICGIPTEELSITIGVLAGSSATIESVEPVTVTTEDYECNMTSNTFKVDDYSAQCTILINACNTEDGLGFVFEDSSFSPRIRLDGKLKGMKYENERSIYEDSLGEKTVNYFAGRKSKTLCIDMQPEYVHDFLRLLVGFDNWYIDGQLYFVEDDEYTVDINQANDNIGNVKLLVSKRVQNTKNTSCSNSEAVGCVGIAGETVTIKNSDNTFSQVVLCGSVFVIGDITFNVYVDGVLQTSFDLAANVAQTINITY